MKSRIILQMQFLILMILVAISQRWFDAKSVGRLATDRQASLIRCHCVQVLAFVFLGRRSQRQTKVYYSQVFHSFVIGFNLTERRETRRKSLEAPTKQRQTKTNYRAVLDSLKHIIFTTGHWSKIA